MCDGGGGAPSSPSSLLLLRCCCWTSRDEKENCCHSLAWGVSGATPSLGLKWQTFRGAARAGRLRQNKAAWLNLAWTPPPSPYRPPPPFSMVIRWNLQCCCALADGTVAGNCPNDVSLAQRKAGVGGNVRGVLQCEDLRAWRCALCGGRRLASALMYRCILFRFLTFFSYTLHDVVSAKCQRCILNWPSSETELVKHVFVYVAPLGHLISNKIGRARCLVLGDPGTGELLRLSIDLYVCHLNLWSWFSAEEVCTVVFLPVLPKSCTIDCHNADCFKSLI